MDKLKFIVCWSKKKETAWSGTNYSIFNALSQYYNITECKLKHRCLFLSLLQKIHVLNPFSYSSILRRYNKWKYRGLKGKVFQFEEICEDTPDRQTYIYMDLSVSYIKYMRDILPSIYKVSGFQNTYPKAVDKRCNEQDNYLKGCSGIFTMGHWLKDYLVSQGFSSDKIFHVGGGYNVKDELYNPIHKTGTKILFVGKDFERKGGHVTYEAFKLLKHVRIDVELYVSGPVDNPIANPIGGYHFMGQLPFEKVADLYNMCDIFCMPSYFEAYGLVFVEALSFGLPCIGRNCYEMPYFIEEGKTGYLLKNDDAKELAELMNKLLSDEEIKNNVKLHREYYLNKYSWNSVALRMKEVIEH